MKAGLEASADKMSREARAFAVEIFLPFMKRFPAIQAKLHGKDPAIWDFFVAIAAMGTGCLGSPAKDRKRFTRAVYDGLASRHPDTGRALKDFIAAAEDAADPAKFAGTWVISHLTLRKATAAESAAAGPLGELIVGRFGKTTA